ncbi:MAG: YIP1 family protein [Lachnospiraceae bacterium]|nr:YIP1 family protein [Lachnospiraceae bacterium]
MASKRSIRRKKLTRYKDSLKFGFYCITHPIDGFWDLTHEKRGTMAAANTILFATVFMRIISLKYTSFIFNDINWEEVNILLYVATIIFPLALWVVGNWALTTLSDGKGRLNQVYMATCYGMLPYPIVQLFLMLFSNVVTVDEAGFYTTVGTLTLVYCAILIVCAMGQIHEYRAGKNIMFTIFSLFAILVEIFILLLFFSMISQGVAYIVSLVKEMLFRI